MDSTELVIKDENEIYQPLPQFPSAYSGLRDIKWLFNRLESGVIDVDPEYQRDIVWTTDRMTGLIDSLMQNCLIPPIILNNITNRASSGPDSSTYVCVDGKQRLTSIKKFIEGTIPCHDCHGNKWWFAEGVRRRSRLPKDVRKEFLAKVFLTSEFTNLTRPQEEELFGRVQKGMPLNLAEKMQAQTGPWQELARMFVQDFPLIFSLPKDQSRAKPFQDCLSCFSQILEVQHPSAANGIPVLKASPASLPNLLNNPDAVDDDIKSHLANVFKTFNDLVKEDASVFTEVDRGVQTFSTSEIVAVAVLISMYSETRNNKLLLGDIRLLLTELRDNNKDLRINRTLWSFTWKFLENLEDYRGAVDRSTTERTVNAETPSPRVTTNPSSSAVKRGRPTLRTHPAKVVTMSTNASAPDTLQRKRPRLDDSPQDFIRTPTTSPTFQLAPQSKDQGSASVSVVLTPGDTSHLNVRRDEISADSTPTNTSGLASNSPMFGANNAPQFSDHAFVNPALSEQRLFPTPEAPWKPINGRNTFRAPIAPIIGPTVPQAAQNHYERSYTVPADDARNNMQLSLGPDAYNQRPSSSVSSIAERTYPSTPQDQRYDAVGAALAARTSQREVALAAHPHSHSAQASARKTPVLPSNQGRKPPSPPLAVQPVRATTARSARPMPLAATSSSIAPRPAPTSLRPNALTTPSSLATSARSFSEHATMQSKTTIPAFSTPSTSQISLFVALPAVQSQQQHQPQSPPRRSCSSTSFNVKPVASSMVNHNKNIGQGTASLPFAINGAVESSHEVIDLTSDTEQERQNLLSSFRMRTEKVKKKTHPLDL